MVIFFRAEICDDGDEGADSDRVAQIQGVHGIQKAGGHQSEGRSDAEAGGRIQTISRIQRQMKSVSKHIVILDRLLFSSYKWQH